MSCTARCASGAIFQCVRLSLRVRPSPRELVVDAGGERTCCTPGVCRHSLAGRLTWQPSAFASEAHARVLTIRPQEAHLPRSATPLTMPSSTFDAGAVRRSAYCSGTLTLIATALAVALITINVTSPEHGCDMKEFTVRARFWLAKWLACQVVAAACGRARSVGARALNGPGCAPGGAGRPAGGPLRPCRTQARCECAHAARPRDQRGTNTAYTWTWGAEGTWKGLVGSHGSAPFIPFDLLSADVIRSLPP